MHIFKTLSTQSVEILKKQIDVSNVRTYNPRDKRTIQNKNKNKCPLFLRLLHAAQKYFVSVGRRDNVVKDFVFRCCHRHFQWGPIEWKWPTCAKWLNKIQYHQVDFLNNFQIDASWTSFLFRHLQIGIQIFFKYISSTSFQFFISFFYFINFIFYFYQFSRS